MCGLTQDIYLLRQALLKHFAQIFQQMPAIEHLLGLWSPFCCPFEVAAPPISTDDLNARMRQKPVCQHLLVTTQQDSIGRCRSKSTRSVPEVRA